MDQTHGPFTIYTSYLTFEMFYWLRPLWLMFYSPARGMSEARDRAPLFPAAVLAFLTQAAYGLYTQWPYLFSMFARRNSLVFVAVFIQAASSIISAALIFVPATILIARLFDRRSSLRITLQKEFAPVACIVFYTLAAADIAAFPVAFILRASGWLVRFSLWYAAYIMNIERTRPDLAGMIDQQLHNPIVIAAATLQMLTLPIMSVLVVIGVRIAFRLSWLRAIVVVIGSAVVMLIGAVMFSSVIGAALASPFILILIFLLLRGYFGEVMRTHRARLAFRQNLEASTLNPADASAHYNLGLIHQERNELDEARQRFERAVEIDNEEVDAHYQLGRIARQENRLADAIKHFEPVVVHDPAHAQHEVWREIGGTYLAAGQFEDARNALEKFLDQRESDPEGLYLMGRTHAALGHEREAAASMQACIDVVNSSPAYKYRAEKRWLNEAQEFLKSKA